MPIDKLSGNSFSTGAIANSLGYTPANRAGDTFTGATTFANSVTVAASGVTFNDATTLNTAPSIFGFKNRIINGAMDVWQRNTSFSAGSTQFTADRYSTNSSTGATSRSTDVPSGQGFTYSMLQTSSNQAFCVLQPIELPATGKAGEYVVGSTWTCSFWMKGASSGSISLSLEFRDTGIDGTNLVAAATGTTINYTSTWTKYTYTFTITGTPAGTNRSLSLIFYQGGQTNSLYVTGLQFEKGPTATAFDFRPYGAELQLCQRYCWAGTSAIYGYFAFSGNIPMGTWNSFPVTMRNAPTVTFGTPTTTSLTNSEAAGYVSSSGFVYYVNITATGTIARSNPTLAVSEI